MAEPDAEPRHDELLADIAEQYHVGEKSKVDIAKSFGLSRFQVARYLDEARTRGIVEIRIRRESTTGLSATLATHLGISGVHIAPLHQGEGSRAALAAFAAPHILNAIRPGDTLGISWSRTLNLAVPHLKNHQARVIVQLAGALTNQGDGNSVQLVHTLAETTGATTWALLAPLVVDDAATARGLRAQTEVRQTLQRARNLDVSVIAIGGWSPTSTVWARVDAQTQAEGLAAGAVAEVSGRLINLSGEPVATSLDERIIAASIDDITTATTRIGVSRGAENALAVIGATAAGVANTIIIDSDLAAALAAHFDNQ